jgi:PleD family two-component response regulator
MTWPPCCARQCAGWPFHRRRGTAGNDTDPSAQPGRAGPARVLVADDNADMREYLARLLRSAGYQVTTVTDGQAALDAVRAGAPTW